MRKRNNATNSLRGSSYLKIIIFKDNFPGRISQWLNARIFLPNHGLEAFKMHANVMISNDYI
jgi:hypothetical protein